jgi:hypothetical protein
MMDVTENRASRFRAYLDRKYHVLWMEKSEWERLLQDHDENTQIDIAVTPMAQIIHSAKVVGSYIEKPVDGDTIIKIFRYDPKDTPHVINLDKYRLWNDISNPIVYSPIVTLCSTCDDGDFRSFIGDYVCIVPMPKGRDHHIEELPDKYKK